MSNIGVQNLMRHDELLDDIALQQAVRQQEKQQQVHDLRKCKQSLPTRELQIKREQRKECARQLRALQFYFDSTSSAVYASSVRIMDTVLMKVKIPWKYMSCFSAACFFIACKWIEDDHEPLVPVLTDLHVRQWKEVDLRRMEERVLQILGWQLPMCTYLTFLPRMMRVLSACQVTLPPMDHVISVAERLLLSQFSFMFTPAAVALGSLSHCFRQSGICGQALSCVLLLLQDTVQVLDSELYEVDQLLLAGNCQQLGAYQCNKAYFPKVFATPCDSFCLDYRLHSIPEERIDGAATLDWLLDVPPPASDSDSSTDWDCSQDECSLSQTFTSTPDSRLSVQDHKDTEEKCTNVLDCTPEQSLLQQGFKHCQTHDTSSISVSEEVVFCSKQDNSCGVHNADTCPDMENNSGEQDSGCEQDADEQDSSSESDACEQDSGFDQDSDEQ